MIFTYSRPYIDAAKLLVKDGFEPTDTAGSIIPKVFVRGEEVVYLYSPIVPEGYEFVPAAGHGWRIDREAKVVYHPRSVADPRAATAGADRPWMPRPYKSRPRMYDIRDAAEHMGLTEHAIRAAIYRRSQNPLVPTERKTEGRFILFSDEDLYEWATRRRSGSPRSKNYRTKGLLSTMSRERLAAMTETAIKAGEMDSNAVKVLLMGEGYAPADIDKASVEEIAQALRTVSRTSLIDVLAK